MQKSYQHKNTQRFQNDEFSHNQATLKPVKKHDIMVLANCLIFMQNIYNSQVKMDLV
jgi:hypothetical protein